MNYENPEEYITTTFKELRRLYEEGHRKQIEDEIVYMTHQYLHDDTGKACVGVVRNADYTVFDGGADVVCEYLTEYDEGITDLAAEAIVRRLVNDNNFIERAHVNSWLENFGFCPLKRVEK